MDAIRSLSLGEKARFFVSYKRGFGREGLSIHVAPNSDLLYEISLVGVRPAETAAQNGGAQDVDADGAPLAAAAQTELLPAPEEQTAEADKTKGDEDGEGKEQRASEERSSASGEGSSQTDAAATTDGDKVKGEERPTAASAGCSVACVLA
jgi:hypothetical protein